MKLVCEHCGTAIFYAVSSKNRRVALEAAVVPGIHVLDKAGKVQRTAAYRNHELVCPGRTTPRRKRQLDLLTTEPAYDGTSTAIAVATPEPTPTAPAV
jgi:hypothetical protein